MSNTQDQIPVLNASSVDAASSACIELALYSSDFQHMFSSLLHDASIATQVLEDRAMAEIIWYKDIVPLQQRRSRWDLDIDLAELLRQMLVKSQWCGEGSRRWTAGAIAACNTDDNTFTGRSERIGQLAEAWVSHLLWPCEVSSV